MNYCKKDQNKENGMDFSFLGSNNENGDEENTDNKGWAGGFKRQQKGERNERRRRMNEKNKKKRKRAQ